MPNWTGKIRELKSLLERWSASSPVCLKGIKPKTSLQCSDDNPVKLLHQYARREEAGDYDEDDDDDYYDGEDDSDDDDGDNYELHV